MLKVRIVLIKYFPVLEVYIRVEIESRGETDFNLDFQNALRNENVLTESENQPTEDSSANLS